METIEELREQLVKANEEKAQLTAKLETATKTNKEQADKITELTTYNNKLFSRLSFEEEQPQNNTSTEITEEEQVNNILKLMNKGGNKNG